MHRAGRCSRRNADLPWAKVRLRLHRRGHHSAVCIVSNARARLQAHNRAAPPAGAHFRSPGAASHHHWRSTTPAKLASAAARGQGKQDTHIASLPGAVQGQDAVWVVPAPSLTSTALAAGRPARHTRYALTWSIAACPTATAAKGASIGPMGMPGTRAHGRWHLHTCPVWRARMPVSCPSFPSHHPAQ